MSKKKHGAPVETWPRDIPCMREDCAPGLDAQGRGVWAPEHATEQAEEHCPVSCEARTWAPWGTGFTVRDPSPSACPRPAPAPGTWRHPETRAALRVRIAEKARAARADLPPGEQMELASQALDARLDRERRQACRRGALTAWRFACGQRAIERDWRKATPDEFQSREDLDEWAALAHEDRVTEVRRALAFRAAARAK